MQIKSRHTIITTVIAAIITLTVTSIAIAGSVPETGQQKCYDNTKEIVCPKPGEAFYGQDSTLITNPRSYTKLDSSGNSLPDSAGTWATVRDNVTGLTWEVKNSKDGTKDYDNPNDADNTYTWYDSSLVTSGDQGTASDKTDTEDFINALNSAQYGGYSDWRMPTVKELSMLVNRGETSPMIERFYFPNTFGYYYWSSSTYASITIHAWSMYFILGHGHVSPKSNSFYVRAVREGQ
ncbi:DUF1566 domain-containing protein [Desulfobacterales bacterium HSG16]|nr:DUF1566 domain-containing protein [Desulfobacterales bacterium HSG16]